MTTTKVNSKPAAANSTVSKTIKQAQYSGSFEPIEQYLKEIRAAKLLTREEEIYYARLAKTGDPKAREKMIVSNLRLVVKIARRYVRSDLSIGDLIEEGNIGLMHAVEKFDPEKGFRFSTYGAWWIQQTIERAIMNQSRTIRLPVHVSKQLNALIKVRRELSAKLAHEPTVKDIAKAMDKSERAIEHILSLNEKTLSMDHPVSSDIDKPLKDTLSSDADLDPARKLGEDQLVQCIKKWLGSLTEKQRAVVVRRFGLMGHEVTTLDQTGKEIGLTRERVRQIQTESLKKMKKLIEGQGNDCDSLLNNF